VLNASLSWMGTVRSAGYLPSTIPRRKAVTPSLSYLMVVDAKSLALTPLERDWWTKDKIKVAHYRNLAQIVAREQGL